ncbi:hypothetical protein acdb102_02710 [Acidothermaceae bacterium B102]|nr:hypothetical protein acdb102_02710 [Acidothermaceae bacterium B102]
MRADMTRALVALSLSGLVGGAVLVLPAASAAAAPGTQLLAAATVFGGLNGWSIIKEYEPAIVSSATATFVTGPSGAHGMGSLALATGPGTPGTPNRSGKIYLTETFPGAGIDPTRLTELNYRTQSGTLAPYLSVELYDASAAPGQTYQNLIWTPGNVAGTPAITPGTWQDWDTSIGGWVARYNVGGLTKGTSYTLAAAEASAKATDPALLAIRASVVYGDTNYGDAYANTTAYVDGLSLGLDGTTTDYDVDNGLGQCQVTQDGATKTFTMLSDCSTAFTVTVPDGWTVDGAGHSLIGTETANTSFQGAILQNAGTSMNIRNLSVHTTPAWDNAGKNSGGDLEGIKFLAASGSVTNTTVDGVSHGNGVQEGKGILVDNRTHPLDPNFHAFVTLDDVTVTDYQKAGVDIRGDVNGRLTNSVVGQSASPSGVRTDKVTAANSVVVAYGANAVVSGNTITGNDWDGNTDWNATAVLGYQAGTLTVSDNVLDGPGTDVGVDVESSTAVVVTCNLIGRSAEDPAGLDVWDTGIISSGNAAADVEGNTFAGWRDNTAGVVNHTGGACAPAAPAVSVSGIHTSTASVSWTPATPLPYAPVSGWEIVTPDGHAIDLPPSGRSFDLIGLAAGAAQTVQVRAINAAGAGALATANFTTSADFSTATLPAPGAVSAIAVSNLSDTGFHLTWTPADGATSYEVNVDGVLESVTSPSIVVTGLTPSTPYLVTIIGRNAQGNGAAGVVLAVTSPAPDTTTRLTFSASGTTVAYHGKVTFKAAVTSGASPLAGTRVTLQRQVPNHAWATVATLTTNANGVAAATLRAAATASYRVVTATNPAVTGGSVKVNVRTVVSAHLSASRALRNARITVTGAVSPTLSGARVVVERKMGAKWITVSHAIVSSKSRYGASVQLTTPGTWKIRVRVAAFHGFLTGVAATRTVTVR